MGAKYTGKTNRSAEQIRREHQKAIAKKKQNNIVYKHYMTSKARASTVKIANFEPVRNGKCHRSLKKVHTISLKRFKQQSL